MFADAMGWQGGTKIEPSMREPGGTMHLPAMKWIGMVSAGVAMMAMEGCATYQPQPLDTSPKLASSFKDLRIHMDASIYAELPASWLRHPVNVGDGIDETEAVLLAVLNSPQLEAARGQMTEAKASLYAAGLLPDPQASASLDFSRSKDPAVKTGESFGLGIDLQQILTRGARRDAATEQAKATYLNVLWQELQVIQQARMLWRRALIQQQQLVVLQDQFRQAETTWKGLGDALAHGNATVDQEGLALAPMMDARAAVEEAKRQINATMHDFHLLLGVDPSAPLVLAKGGNISSLISAPPTGVDLESVLAGIATKRPDILALKAGYMSQENKVREQILSQFPSFSVGANSLRDTAGLWTLGPFVNLNLPILNGNRGNVAMARATRKRLHEEFHFQLTSAYLQASKMAGDQRLAYNEWKSLAEHLPELDNTTMKLSRALGSGDVDMLTFTTLRTAYFAQQARVLTLEQTLLEQNVALETLTGTLLSDPDAREHPPIAQRGSHAREARP